MLSIGFLQKGLCEFVTDVTKNIRLKFPGQEDGDQDITLHVYSQRLPKPVHKDQEEVGEYDESEEYEEDTAETTYDNVFPFALVQVDGGTIAGPDDPTRVQVTIYFGTYEPDEKTAGDQDIYNLIETVCIALVESHVIADSWHLDRGKDGTPMISWELSDEDAYPYYFGALTFVCSTAPPKNMGGSEFT